MKNDRLYRRIEWSWFYKNFIHGTVNDNFFTPKEIIEKKRKIIKKVKEYSLNKEGKQT